MNAIAIPTHPLPILTPPAHKAPDEETLKLIETQAKELIQSDKKFSVTFSPMLAPAGKNFLFTLHPHYWKVMPGHWEWRDGQRNPYAAIPQGQEQAENFSMAIRILALAVKHIPDLATAAQQKAEELLQVFFVDPETRMRPEVLYSQCIPGQEPLTGSSTFIFACRFLILVSQYLPLLKLDLALEGQVKEWVRQHVQWMKHSEQGIECANRTDTKAVWYRAILATHLNLVDPPQARNIAQRFFDDSVKKYPVPADYFKQITAKARRRHLTCFLLEPTFLLADILAQSGHLTSDFKDYFKGLIEHAKKVEKGEIETPSEDDVRYFKKISLFEKLLATIECQVETPRNDKVDGQGWPGGWGGFMAVSWGLI